MLQSYELKEILDHVADTHKLEDRIAYLKQMDAHHNGRLKFAIALIVWEVKYDQILEHINVETFKRHGIEAGLCEDSWSYLIQDVIEKFYDRAPKNVIRVSEQVIRWLEMMYDDDRDIILAALRNEDVHYKGLTESAIRRAFPGLLPDADQGK